MLIMSGSLCSDSQFIVPDKLGPSDFDFQVVDTFLNNGGQGILTGLIGDPILRASHLQLSYYSKSGTPINAKFLMVNSTGMPIRFSIICLVDYLQQSCAFDGLTSKFYNVALEPKEKRIFPVTFPGLPEGAHDIVLLVVGFPEELESGALIQPEHPLYFYRANVFVDSYTFPRKEARAIEVASASQALPHIVLNGKSEITNFNEISQDKIFDTNTANYYAHVSSIRSHPTKYALTVFANGEQLPINKEETVLYYSLDARATGSIPLTVQTDKKLTHVWAITIENPYARLEPNPAEIGPTPSRIFISNTVEVIQ